MALGNLPVPGRPTIWMKVGQGPTALAVAAGGGCLDIISLVYPFSPLSPSLWETARYRLKYCLKGPLNPKPTNQPNRRSSQSSQFLLDQVDHSVGWLFWFNGPLRQYVSLYRAVSLRKGEGGEQE